MMFFTLIGYATTIYFATSLATALFLLNTKQASLKDFSGWRIVRWLITIPLIMLEEITRKDKR